MNTPHPAISRSHHNSHLGLLKPADAYNIGTPSLDAIVVPTARPFEDLRAAVTLAGKLDRPLVALCSHDASITESVKLGEDIGANVTAVKIEKLPDNVIPQFSTTDLLGNTEFAQIQDTGTKRNLALLIARLMGWQRIVFLDDDIEVSDPQDLLRATQLLDQYAAVGLSIGDFPDNSVVCHAHRETGGPQRTFVGAGALAVDTTSITSFFPDIYNEDWFFLLDGERLSPVTITGSATQRQYDPYANPGRAVHEELGDCLAEGVYWLLDTQQTAGKADLDFWTDYLRTRREFIYDIMCRVEKSPRLADKREQMVSALDAALDRCKKISPVLCVAYLQAWLKDRHDWRQHVEDWVAMYGRAQPGAELDKVLADLGLLSSSCRTRTLHSSGATPGRPPGHMTSAKQTSLPCPQSV